MKKAISKQATTPINPHEDIFDIAMREAVRQGRVVRRLVGGEYIYLAVRPN